MTTRLRHAFFAVGLFIFGSLSTILIEVAKENDAPVKQKSNERKKFDHPYVQLFAMFLGELICFPFYWLFYCARPSSRDANSVRLPMCKWLLFLPPALMGAIAWITLCVGLVLTYSTSLWILRGAAVIFTGLMSVAFLGRSVRAYMWVGISTITFGLMVSGLSDLMVKGVNSLPVDANGIVSGDLLIILAQIISATQFVYEEKYLKKHNVAAALAVGLEGLFGSVILGAILYPLWYIPASKPFSMTPGHLEDVCGAWIQMTHNPKIMAATICLVFSTAASAFCGMSVTKEMSATSRQVIDSCRIVSLWIVVLAVGSWSNWTSYDYRAFPIQLLGFLIVIVGIMIYFNILLRPFLIRHNLLRRRTRQLDSREGTANNEDYDDDDEDDERRVIIGRD